MQDNFIVFDLDGTISDPKNGIVRSMNYALEAYGLKPREESELVKYIGPPLDLAFQELAETTDQTLVLSLVSKYRERYAAIGYSENFLYEGVVNSLTTLASNHPLAICTTKRIDFAEQIVEMFDLKDLFQVISGGDVGISKTQQLSELIDSNKIGKLSIMVGDRNADLIGAHNNQLKSVGVLWGYGSLEELSKEQPSMILETPTQLKSIIIT